MPYQLKSALFGFAITALVAVRAEANLPAAESLPGFTPEVASVLAQRTPCINGYRTIHQVRSGKRGRQGTIVKCRD